MPAEVGTGWSRCRHLTCCRLMLLAIQGGPPRLRPRYCHVSSVAPAVAGARHGHQGAAGHAAPAPTAIQARTTAYVTGRVEKALAATRLVMQTRYSFSPAFPAITQWNYRGNFRMDQSGFIPAAVGLPWASGQVSFGVGTATINGKRAYVQVDYRRHEWYATPRVGFAPTRCSTVRSWWSMAARLTGRHTSGRRSTGCPTSGSRAPCSSSSADAARARTRPDSTST